MIGELITFITRFIISPIMVFGLGWVIFRVVKDIILYRFWGNKALDILALDILTIGGGVFFIIDLIGFTIYGKMLF